MSVVPEVWRAGELVARRLTETDVADLVALHEDPLVMAHLGGLRDEQATVAYVRTNVGHWEEHGFGLFVLRQEDGTFLGRAGLRFARPLGVPEVEVAYALASHAWGCGYALGATETLCSLAAEAGLCRGIMAFTETSNRPSWRVMQKAGFTFDCQFVYAGAPHVLYRRELNVIGAA